MNLDALFDAIDRKDTEAFLSFLTPDASFRFGSSPPISGHAAIRDGVDAFFDSIANSRHEIGKVIRSDDSLICEGSVLYQTHDGREVPVPFVDVFECRDERISDYKIYIDLSPLFAD